jgi:hypothetical protein
MGGLLELRQYISKRLPVGSRKYKRPLMPSRVHGSVVTTPFWRSHATMSRKSSGSIKKGIVRIFVVRAGPASRLFCKPDNDVFYPVLDET